MRNEVEKFEVGGLTVRIMWEEDASFCDPRDADNVTTMFCWHPDYVLGDEQFRRGDYDSMEDVRQACIERATGVVLPLILFDHSGVTMRVGNVGDIPGDAAGWDTTHVGYVFCEESKLANCCGDGAEYRTDEWTEKACRIDVAVYASWLEGEVYWYSVEDEEGETLDSCSGFVGDMAYVMQEARASAEWYARERRLEDEPKLDVPEALTY